MLLSIIVYSSLALTLFALGWHLSQREAKLKAATGQTLPFWSWEIILSIVIFATVAGARYHTGYDHAMYLGQYVSYQKYGFFTRDFEPLFMWVTQLMAGAHIHYFFYFALWAAIELTLLYYALNNYKSLIPWVALIIVLGPTFVHLMNTVRQGVVECSVPLLFLLVRDKKYLQFSVLVILLAMVHATAVLLFALCLVRWKVVPATFRNWTIILFITATIVGVMPFWLEWFTRLTHSLMDGSLIHYGSEMSINEHHFTVSIGPARVAMLFCQLMVLWLAKDMLMFFRDNRLLHLITMGAAVYVIGSSLMCNTTNFYQRPFELFIVCFVLILAATVFYLLKSGKKMLAFLLIVLNATPLIFAIIKAHLYPIASNLPTLYHFCFNQ